MCNCSKQTEVKKHYFVEISLTGSVKACCLEEATDMADYVAEWETVEQDVVSVEEAVETE